MDEELGMEQADMNWIREFRQAASRLFDVASLAGYDISGGGLELEFLPRREHPSGGLPDGFMAVYAFHGDGRWLKVGQAGPNSNARYKSQHYYTSTRSTLASSLLAEQERGLAIGINPDDPRSWIRDHTDRANLLMDARLPHELLPLAEAFFIARLRPVFEQEGHWRKSA